MLLESSTQTTTQSEPQPVTSSYSYSIIETNIFGSTPTPSVPEFPVLALEVVVFVLIVVITAFILVKRRK
jgi:hypothetical protein